MRMVHFCSRIGIAELAPGTAAPRLAASVQSLMTVDAMTLPSST